MITPITMYVSLTASFYLNWVYILNNLHIKRQDLLRQLHRNNFIIYSVAVAQETCLSSYQHLWLNPLLFIQMFNYQVSEWEAN